MSFGGLARTLRAHCAFEFKPHRISRVSHALHSDGAEAFTMSEKPILNEKPPLIVSNLEHPKLVTLAELAARTNPAVAEQLLAEMDRAMLVEHHAMPPQVVRMGSIVDFRSNSSQSGRVTLVYPHEADIAFNNVSVLTPIGAALIGLSVGQSITWITSDGRERELTILRVEQPANEQRLALSGSACG
jgi:regulator of nucleoside diphosphate kinase